MCGTKAENQVHSACTRSGGETASDPKLLTAYNLNIRTVLIFNNSNVPQIPLIITALVFILINVSFLFYYSF